MRAHPTEGALRALLDGEAGPLEATRLRAHLGHCASCRELVAELRELDATVTSLLRGAAPAVDVDDEWARLVVRSGGRAARAVGRRAPATARATTGAKRIAAAVALGAIVVTAATLRSAAHPLGSAEVYGLVREARAAGGEAVRDACCQDHDGGALEDDGLLTLSQPGERVTVVVVYEDVDRSGTFTPGDVVRHVSTTPRR